MASISEQVPPAAPISAARSNLIVAALLCVSIVVYLDRQIPLVLAEKIKTDLGLSDTQLGMLGGLTFALCYSALALPLARLADSWSAKKVIVGSVLIWGLLTAFGGLARSFGELAVSRLGVAIGGAGCTPSAHALISRLIPAERRGAALGLFMIAVPSGTMLGLALGGWMSDYISWRSALLATGALALVSLVPLLLFVPEAGPARARSDRTGFFGSVTRLFASPVFRWLFLAFAIAGTGIYSLLVFSAPFLVRAHGLSTAQIGLALGFMQGLGGMAGALIGGRVFDRARGKGRDFLLLPAIAMMIAAPFAVLAWLVPSGMICVLLLLPVSFAYSFYLPATFGVGHIVAGEGHQATASSVLIIGVSAIGASLGPLIVGAVSDALTPSWGVEGIRWALMYVPFATGLAGICFWMANRRLAAAA